VPQGYTSQPPAYEPNLWPNDSSTPKPAYPQQYGQNSIRQDVDFYGNSQSDTFNQYGAPYNSNMNPVSKRSNKYDDAGLHAPAIHDPYYAPTHGYPQDLQQKPLGRPAHGQMQHGYNQQQPMMQQGHHQMHRGGMPGRGGMYPVPPQQGGAHHNPYGMGMGMGMNNMRPGPPQPGMGYGMPMFPGGSNAQGRAINKMLLDILRERVIDPQRLDMAIDTYIDRMDCVNLATLLFHTGKKRILLAPAYIKRVAGRFVTLKEELRAREASNALYGLKCMTSELPEVRELIYAIGTKLSATSTEFVAQAVGNALYGLQMMTSEYEEIRYILTVLAVKVSRCSELLEAQNVGNALYGLRNMSSDYREVRTIIAALTPRIATAREDLNGQALGNSLYGLQSMSSKESEVRFLLAVLATKVTRTWEDLKAQEVGNALYGLKRMSTDVPEVRMLISALVPKVAASPEILDAQAIGNSFYGLQNMHSDNPEVLSLLAVMADKVAMSCPELDGQAMGNSLYGLQGMSSDYPEVRAVVSALTTKIQASCLDMNAQELGNALYGLQNMTSEHADVRRLLTALTHKVNSSKHDLTSQEIGNAIFGLQGMSSSAWETRMLVRQIAIKIQQSHSVIDPLGIANCLFGLQRMSSESEDVRLLVQALSIKIEHSWKVLSAQHIANALFGLQGLSSAENEVRFLLKALLPKIAACRDELSAKQLSQAVFGLRGFSSEHAEVLALVAALAEKVSASTEPWTLTQLSMVMFGLQGMSSNKEEVGALLAAVGHKAADLVPERAVDPNALANCLFGFQRMNTNSAEVCRLLPLLAAKMAAPSLSTPANARMCASIAFGMQALSCVNETVKRMLYQLAGWMQQISSNFLSAPRPGGHDLYGMDKTGEAVTPVDRVEDILCLYQSLALSLFAMRDLDADPDLQARLYAELSALRNTLDNHRDEVPPPVLTAAEKRMTRELSDLLAHEPYNVITGVVVQGFEMSAFVQLYAGLNLKTAAGKAWAPVLNLEVRGSSYSFPAKELFFRLRKHFLEQECSISVDAVPADSFRIEGQQGLKIHSAVLSPLYPPTMDDATQFASRLNNLSKSGQFGPGIGIDGFFTFAGGISIDHALDVSNANMPPLEYHDDDFKRTSSNSYNDNKKYKFNPSARGQKVPLGLPLSWLGEWPVPVLTQTLPVQGPSSAAPGAPIGSSPTISPKGQDDRTLVFPIQGGSSNSLLSGMSSASLATTLLGTSNGRTNYQSELNAQSPPSPAGHSRQNSAGVPPRPVGYRAPGDESDSSQGSNSPHNRSAQTSGNLEPYAAAARVLAGADARQNGAGHLAQLQLSGLAPRLNSSSSEAYTPTSAAPTLVQGFSRTPTYANGVSQATSTTHPADGTVLDSNQQPASGENSEVDEEIAALEAQLEVARLEARIKELKSKKSFKSSPQDAPAPGQGQQSPGQPQQL
jgi:hypothetical protein